MAPHLRELGGSFSRLYRFNKSAWGLQVLNLRFLRNYSSFDRSSLEVPADVCRKSGIRRAGGRPYLVMAASTRKAQPPAPKSKLTIQNRRLRVRAEIAAMAIAIWNMVTPRANTSCL